MCSVVFDERVGRTLAQNIEDHLERVQDHKVLPISEPLNTRRAAKTKLGKETIKELR